MHYEFTIGLIRSSCDASCYLNTLFSIAKPLKQCTSVPSLLKIINGACLPRPQVPVNTCSIPKLLAVGLETRFCHFP